MATMRRPQKMPQRRYGRERMTGRKRLVTVDLPGTATGDVVPYGAADER
jgi:hypothetical protein